MSLKAVGVRATGAVRRHSSDQNANIGHIFFFPNVFVFVFLIEFESFPLFFGLYLKVGL